ncbi:hypothetical protein PENSPDRAFT_207892 [Peniophora sp. CONT]|nr:hypothetical protein PENSPDRAFT_207892 [Peniophora sp. CONT]
MFSRNARRIWIIVCALYAYTSAVLQSIVSTRIHGRVLHQTRTVNTMGTRTLKGNLPSPIGSSDATARPGTYILKHSLESA